MNSPDLKVFVNSGFDMEFWDATQGVLTNRDYFIGKLTKSFSLRPFEMYYESCRNRTHRFVKPRLNEQQVLDDYIFIESLEGFLWDIAYHCYDEVIYDLNILIKDYSPSFIADVNKDIQWLSFKGVAKGSIHEEWAIKNNVPVLEV